MKKNSFFRAATISLILVVMGKILGFVKQIILAYFYGTSISSDIFFTSYSFISGIAMMFFSALAIIVLPKYEKNKNSNELLSSIIILSIPIIVIISLFMFIFSNQISSFLAPGFSKTSLFQLSKFIKCLIPVFIFSSFSYIYNISLESNKRFTPGKCFTLIFNLLIILFTIFMYKYIGLTSLILATLISYLLYFIIIVVSSKKYFSFKLVDYRKYVNIKKILYTLMPILIGNAIAELNSIVDRIISSNLAEGSISALTYGASINEIVTVLIIGTISSVFYPYITSLVKEDNKLEVRKKTFDLLNVLICMLIPFTIVFVVGSNSITKIIFLRGNFNLESAKLTSLVIIGYAIGFIPAAIRNILIKVHYSYSNTKSPMINGIISVSINILLSYFLSKKIGIFGIALATSISTIVSSILTIITIKLHLGNISQFINLSKILKLFLFSAMNFILYYIIFNYAVLDNTIMFIVFTSLYFVIYYVTLNIFKVDGVDIINDLIKKSFTKFRVFFKKSN